MRDLPAIECGQATNATDGASARGATTVSGVLASGSGVTVPPTVMVAVAVATGVPVAVAVAVAVIVGVAVGVGYGPASQLTITIAVDDVVWPSESIAIALNVRTLLQAASAGIVALTV
jgi:hypothetical protein